METCKKTLDRIAPNPTMATPYGQLTRADVFVSSGRLGLSSGDSLASGDFEMMAITWAAGDDIPCDPMTSSDEDEDDNDNRHHKKRPYIPRQYIIRAFGVTVDGTSACMTLTGFLPYFYVRVSPMWGPFAGARLREWLSTAKGCGWKVASCQLVRKKEYIGFHNGETSEFVRVKCHQQFAMRQLSKRLIDGLDENKNVINLSVIGIHHIGPMDVYESNIDPMLRMLHHQGISPAGWVRVSSRHWIVNEIAVPTTCQLDLQCKWTEMCPLQDRDTIAPMIIFSMDIECGSSHGDFPQAKKGMNKLGMEIVQAYIHSGAPSKLPEEQCLYVTACLHTAFSIPTHVDLLGQTISRVFPKAGGDQITTDFVHEMARSVLATLTSHDRTAIESVTRVLDDCLRRISSHADAPSLRWGAAIPDPAGVLIGDPVIQIGVAMHVYGDKDCCQRHIFTLDTCEPIQGTVVHAYPDEASLLLGFVHLVVGSDPDVLIGYNQLGFDFAYLNGRAQELGVELGFLGRLKDTMCDFKKSTLSSSALGDNEYRYFDLTGRCQIDIMKVVQRDHKLDSFKLDAVAEHFLGMHKHGISPNDIFRLQLGTSTDRRVIAEYCVQDCALCHHLLMKLEIIANNVGMANVCSVPLSFLFLRGQGIKILSLVAKRCLAEGFVIPTLNRAFGQQDADGEEGYEGAIVLEPETGMYLTEPVSVLDFASLYPSSMISGNLSHDTFITDPRYDNLPGLEYSEVRYDVRNAKGAVVRIDVCRFVMSTRGILPMILQDLLLARKATRAKIKALQVSSGECDSFLLAVLDGQQVAIKVTANSLYGQTGARTSALYLKQLAACTTAIGRSMIMHAKHFLESEHGARVIYGDTDSVFAVFPNLDPSTGVKLKGEAALRASIDEGKRASKAFRVLLPPPHDLEYEKTFFPLFLLSKKRYVGKKYEHDTHKSEVSSMGLVTKRRDNAPIVKAIYGGMIDILMERQDVGEAERFLEQNLLNLVHGRVDLEQLVISKALKGFYKAPDTIAHFVLARRMGERDPGSKPQVNDRVPYVYIVAPLNLLQGERIEDPTYIKSHLIPVDTTHYVTNQIMKPVLQLMAPALEKLTGYAKDRLMQKGLREVIATGGNVVGFREKAVQKLLFASVMATKPVAELEKKRQRIDWKGRNQANRQLELTRFFSFTQVTPGPALPVEAASVSPASALTVDLV